MTDPWFKRFRKKTTSDDGCTVSIRDERCAQWGGVEAYLTTASIFCIDMVWRTRNHKKKGTLGTENTENSRTKMLLKLEMKLIYWSDDVTNSEFWTDVPGVHGKSKFFAFLKKGFGCNMDFGFKINMVQDWIHEKFGQLLQPVFGQRRSVATR